MHYEHVAKTLRGDRDENQDRCTVVERDNSVLLLLADGMGGHPRGELASQVFIDTMTGRFHDLDLPADDPGVFLENALIRSHHDIIAAGKSEQPPVEPMTTGVACLIQGHTSHWAHVGDSRLYLLRRKRVVSHTLDHSLVEELIQSGEVQEAERNTHPQSNIVTRSLGGAAATPRITLSEKTVLRPRDILLLCSDGLWSSVPESTLVTLTGARSLHRTVDKMAEQARETSRPHSDNITLVALRCLRIKNPDPGL